MRVNNLPSTSSPAKASALAGAGVFLALFCPNAQAQGKYARPDITIATGGWIAVPAVDHYLNIDEVTADDTDYVQFTGPGAGTLVVGLTDITNPPPGNHILRFRMQAAGTGPPEQVKMDLYQGATPITNIAPENAPAGWTTFQYTLSAAEVAAITDYSALELRLASTVGAGDVVRVSWAELFIQEPISSGTNYRSIGTNCGIIYNTGTATVANNSNIVTFGNGASLPVLDAVGAVGVGDRIIFQPGTANQITRYILSRDSYRQVTLQSIVSPAQSAVPYVIRRAFCSLQEWEDLRQGDLVTGNRVEVGVAYKDGPFTQGLTIDGSTTDATRYLRLTVADGQRHQGAAGGGVVLDGVNTDQGIRVQDNFTVVERFELRRIRGSANAASVVVQSASNVLLANLLIHDFDDAGNSVTGVRAEGGASYTLRNSIIYDGDDAGIQNNGATGVVQNCTVYGMNGTGVLQTAGTFTVTNTISMGNTVAAFSGTITPDYNISSDGSGSCPTCLTNRTATANPNPGAGAWVIFYNLTAGSENLHLHTSPENDSWNNGTDLSVSFTDDVDGDIRSTTNSPWDRGADEAGAVNLRSIGSYSTGGYSLGVATVSGGTTVTFAEGAVGEPVPNIPAWVVGYPIVLEPGTANQEERTIDSWFSSTQVTVSLAFSLGHTNVAYDLGNARITAGSTTVTFGADTSLPTWIVNGVDQFTVDPGTANQEVFTIVSRDSPTQLTVSPAATLNHYNRPYTITRRYNTGDASVLLNGTTVTFGAGASLPTWVAVGDRLVIGAETLYIRSRASATQVTIQTGATALHSSEPYSITRAYARLQDWEDARQGNLVAENRLEVAVAYNDGPLHTRPRQQPVVLIDGSTTDRRHYMRLTVAPGQRHQGIPTGSNVVVDCRDGANADITSAVSGIDVRDDYTQVEWFEITRCRNRNTMYGAQAQDASRVVLQQLLIHDFDDPNFAPSGVEADANSEVTVRNSIVYDGNRGIRGSPSASAPSAVTVENCTVYGMQGPGVWESSTLAVFTVKNTISMNSSGSDFNIVNGSQENNVSSDLTAQPVANQGKNPLLEFVNTTPGSENLHLMAGAYSIDKGSDLSARFNRDIDDALRPYGTFWDIGADEFGATTAVELISFTASGFDEAVELTWETAAEVDNLGFYLYRGGSEQGPFERITATLIPGLGSSPLGGRYRYRDSVLKNGETYLYLLEDVETTGARTRHGPVSATPQAGASVPLVASPSPSGIVYGKPEETAFRVVESNRTGLTLELLTGGFTAEPQADGSVRLAVPGFVDEHIGIPVKRVWLDAVVGRKVRITSVQAEDVAAFSSLRPSGAEIPDIVASEGVVRVGSRRSEASYGNDPGEWARLVSVGFQGEMKKALVELSPLRWDGTSLLLARRLVVRVAFATREMGEQSLGGSRGRRHREISSHESERVLARLRLRQPGLYRVKFEELLAVGGRPVAATQLRLSHQGKPVAYHLEGARRRFGPGSVLYFVSPGASLNPYGDSAVYELSVGEGAVRMPVSEGKPSGTPTLWYWQRVEREQNRIYHPALPEAEEPWLWDTLLSPVTKSYPFEVSALGSTAETAQLELWLQGASDFAGSLDHHVRVYVNGSLVTEGSWDGKKPQKLAAGIHAGLLVEGENQLSIENVGDTEARSSMVMLERFALLYPRRVVADAGVVEGLWSESGAAEVEGLLGQALVVDVTEEPPRWLTGVEQARFGAQAGRKYLAVGSDSVLKPEVTRPAASRLKSERNVAEYLVIGPSALLLEAGPLLELRRSQGLQSRAVAIEEVFSEFGYGEERPQAIRDFLTYAYHHWDKPSPRYVLLLGDATYDYKDYLGTGVKNQVPPYLLKTSYWVTAADPTYASVNGEDVLPDLAIGRLPARNPEEARTLVEKIVAYETGPTSLVEGRAVLVVDNPDRGGNFEADATEIAGLLAGRAVETIRISELGRNGTRAAIVQAFDRGASLMSYLGHGAILVWASENVFNNLDVRSLAPQEQQPFLLTMNCLNGYFHFPYLNSLSEELLKADRRGVIAAFSPSGLSLNSPAHRYHKAVLSELLSGRRERLGDAMLGAQATYAQEGEFLELLSIYHLLGDPALRVR